MKVPHGGWKQPPLSPTLRYAKYGCQVWRMETPLILSGLFTLLSLVLLVLGLAVAISTVRRLEMEAHHVPSTPLRFGSLSKESTDSKSKPTESTQITNVG